jgi:hypothetical protein
MKTYSNDPRWISAKYAGTDLNGRAFTKGEDVFYYPRTRAILSGEAAKQAAREFECAAQDEAFMCGETY